MEAPRIWIPRAKVLEAKRELVLPFGIRGRYKLTARPRHHLASFRRETPWFNNLILDQGLNQIGGNFGGSNLNNAFVGTGNTAPNVGDTQLQSLIATSNSILSVSASTSAVSPYGASKTWVFRFNAGVAAGNLAEVGVGNNATSLFSRALIQDDQGNPTTFPVAGDEVLDVTYQITYFPPLADVLGTIEITGSGNHDFIWRASQAGNANGWGITVGSGVGPATNIAIIGIGSNSYQAFSGAIGEITGTPAGTSSTGPNTAFSAYTNGNFYRDVSPTFSLTQGNVVGGIMSIGFIAGVSSANARTSWQCQFDPVIEKDSSKTLNMSYRISWTRG